MEFCFVFNDCVDNTLLFITGSELFSLFLICITMFSTVSCELNADLDRRHGRDIPFSLPGVPYPSPHCSSTRLSCLFFGTPFKSPPQSLFVILQLSSFTRPWRPSFLFNHSVNCSSVYFCASTGSYVIVLLQLKARTPESKYSCIVVIFANIKL